MRAFLCLAPAPTVTHLLLQLDGVYEASRAAVGNFARHNVTIPEEIGIVVQGTPFNTYIVTVGPPPWQ